MLYIIRLWETVVCKYMQSCLRANPEAVFRFLGRTAQRDEAAPEWDVLQKVKHTAASSQKFPINMGGGIVQSGLLDILGCG